MEIVRFEVAGIIRKLYPKLPAGAGYPQLSVSGSSNTQSSFMSYTLVTNLGDKALNDKLENGLLKELSRLDGMDEARVYGLPQKQWLIILDADKISSLGINLDDISGALLGNSLTGGLGIVNYVNSRLPVKISSGTANKSDLENVALLKKGGRIIYFGEIASFVLEDSKPREYYRINGYQTLNMVMIPKEKADQVLLAGQVREVIDQSDLLKSGAVQFIVQKDDSQYIEEEVSKMTRRSLLTLAILLLFVLFTTWSLRYVIIVALSIVANIGLAFLVYYLLGISLHLYSFAGIAVSLGIIIDNTIVMLDHLWHKQNKKVFLALLASTLTTMGSLGVIFFLSERLRLNLIDFAWVVVVNLATSLLVALYLIPALLEKLPLKKGLKTSRFSFRNKRRVVQFSGFYSRFIAFCGRRKWVFFILAILAFGLPVHKLPEHLGEPEKEEVSFMQGLYNKTLGSDFYGEYLKEPIAYGLGGMLRLFGQKVNQGEYFESQKQKTSIVMQAQMPVGATISQMNEVFVRLEGYLKQFKEIDQFETNINSTNNAGVSITFKDAFENTSFPFVLKDLLTRKAIELGSADWQVYGKGPSFDNALRDRMGSFQVEFYGYNYDRLRAYAEELKAKLLPNPRIKEINLVGERSNYRKNIFEYVLREDPERLMLQGSRINTMFYGLSSLSKEELSIGEITREGERYPALLKAEERGLDLWGFNNDPIATRSGIQKLNAVSTMNKEKVPDVISRIDQQYFILLEYDFIGSSQLGRMHLDGVLEDFTPLLPIGYSIKQNSRKLTQDEKEEQIWLIFLVVAIIYIVCAVVLESLLQPLGIIFMVPISFIGVFLTYYLFDLNFDQGGYAAFILLSGLTVNAALYIINDYNQISKSKKGKKNKLYDYLKAFNSKIIPILLAIVSTIVGFIPYLIEGQSASFWFPLAAGTTGGLLFSLLAIYIYLPLFVLKKPKIKNTKIAYEIN